MRVGNLEEIDLRCFPWVLTALLGMGHWLKELWQGMGKIIISSWLVEPCLCVLFKDCLQMMSPFFDSMLTCAQGSQPLTKSIKHRVEILDLTAPMYSRLLQQSRRSAVPIGSLDAPALAEYLCDEKIDLQDFHVSGDRFEDVAEFPLRGLGVVSGVGQWIGSASCLSRRMR